MSVERLWVVEASARATCLIWAKDEAEARADAEAFSEFDVELEADDWEIEECREADTGDMNAFRYRRVWDGKARVSVEELAALCTPEALAEREAAAKAKAEFDSHPKLLEV